MVEFKKFKIGSSYVIRGHEIKNDINGLFEILPTKKRINGRDAKVAGSYNYVSRGTTNNGIAAHIDYDPKFLNEGNTLSFAQDTAAIFYQDQPYFTGNKVNVLRLNSKYGVLKRSVALYLQAAIHSAFPDFTWGTLLNIEKIANTDILLPVTPSGDPDFAYMARRIDELEAQRIDELSAYLKVSGLDNTVLTDEEKDALTKKVTWKKFKVSKFFDIHPTKSYKLTNHELLSDEGKTPVLTNTSNNNGIGGWSKFDPNEDQLMITFSDTTTGADTMFVQDKPFIGYSHVQGMFPKPIHHWNKKELLYVIVNLRAAAGDGWSYATKFNRKIVANLDFLLPVTSNGTIDFDYMQNYITAIEKQSIKGVIAYKDKVIATTKKIVSE